jgi:thiamine phosphate synthase YjbQ (UPF0047 family)
MSSSFSSVKYKKTKTFTSQNSLTRLISLPFCSAYSSTMFRLRIKATATATFLLFSWIRLWTAGAFSPTFLLSPSPSLFLSSFDSIRQQRRLTKFTTSLQAAPLGAPICEYHQVPIPTSRKGVPPRQAISVEDLTPYVTDLLTASGMQQGAVHVISRHTTTAITINESELRLARDMEEYFLSLAPPDERSQASTSTSTSDASTGRKYYHNDIDQRPESEEEAQRCRENGWDIDNAEQLQAWRDQEPINAHSHLLSMLLGSSECIPVVDGAMVIGQWQSILLVDLDGPRDRTVGVQFLGYL